MAKIKKIPGIEVSIISNGNILPEYPDDDDGGVTPGLADRTILRYVESEADKEFAIQFSVKPPYKHDCDYLGFYLGINGEELNVGQLCGPGHLDDRDSWIETVSGIEKEMKVEEETDKEDSQSPGRLTFTKFKFGKITTTSEDGNASPSYFEKAQDLGLLEISVLRVKEGPVIKRLSSAITKSENLDVLPEKFLKGRSISHQILFEDEPREVSQGIEWQDPIFIDGKDHPIAVFRLKCRSKDDLLKEHIIPKQESAPSFTQFEELSEEQKLEFARVRYTRQATRELLMNRGRNKDVTMRAFQELSVEELTKLGREEHLELNRPTSPLAVRNKKRSRADFQADQASPPSGKKPALDRLNKEKVVIDLTSDDSKDIPFPSTSPTPRSRFAPHPSPSSFLRKHPCQ